MFWLDHLLIASFVDCIICWLRHLLIGSFVYLSGLCSQEEERLVRDLFRGYNKLIRPVQNMTQKVEVAFGLAFIQLINVVRRVTLRTGYYQSLSRQMGLTTYNKPVAYQFAAAI